MLTDEQIQWLIPICHEIGDILNNISNFHSDICYHEITPDYFKHVEDQYDSYFFDEEDGFYCVLYLEYGETHIDTYGKTKKEIIQYLINKSIDYDAYSVYAPLKYSAACSKAVALGMKEPSYGPYYEMAKERKQYSHTIVAPYIDMIDDSICPPKENDVPIKTLNEGKYISVISKGEKIIVAVSLTNIHNFSKYRLFVEPDEDSCYAYYDIFKETFRIDITQFWKKTRILTLKDDNVIIECLDIDKKDDTVFQIVTKYVIKWYIILKKGISFRFRK